MEKFCWEHHSQMDPAVSDSDLVKAPRAPDTGWETKKNIDVFFNLTSANITYTFNFRCTQVGD